MNHVILIGNLGKDPELRSTQNGKSVCNFSVATSEGKDQVEWHNIVCWEKTAELCAEYLSKGKKVAIEGRIQHREYEDKDGNKRRIDEIVAHRVEFLSPKSEGQGQSQGGGYGGGGQSQGGYRPGGYGGGAPAAAAPAGGPTDDIPF